MPGEQNPLLFIISEPVGSRTANEVAYRLAEHGVRTWIGSLAPAGELNGSAMDALRASAAALLVFDEAAAHSRHVDRHLLVARQTGKPLIPLRFESTDEGLLRQELLDAQWVDAAAPGAIEEVSRRAFDYDRAQREEARAANAAAPAVASEPPAVEAEARRPRIELLAAGPEAGASAARKPRIEVLHAGPAVAADADPAGAAGPSAEREARPPIAPSSRRNLLRSPTMLIALLALAVLAGLLLYNSSLLRGDGRGNRTAQDGPVTAEYSGGSRVEEQPAQGSDSVSPKTVPDTPAPAPLEKLGPQPSPIETSRPEPIAEPASRQDSTSDAAAPEAPAREAAAGGSSAVATVRAFYSALSRGDGASAAMLVVPTKRQSGPLSGPALSRYFSSFRRPLRLRSVAPVDANTVRVAYDYVLSDGRLCQGQATVDLVQSGGRGLVSGIRTQGPC